MQYFGQQYPYLEKDNIFLTKNWVPKSILSRPPFTHWESNDHWYVISVELSMLFQPTFLLLIDWKTK
jgi:hypothetical protein